jgi:LPXTG-site transpeptidase (sortase) family protein
MGLPLRRAILPVTVAAAAAFVAATGYLAVTEPRPDTDVGRWSALRATATAAAPTEPAWDPLASRIADPFGVIAPLPRGVPTRLRVAAIGVDTPLESLHVGKDGALVPPRNFARAGWYADGTVPGDQGPAVIAGHVDSRRGPAVFYKLRELETGDRIEVFRGGRAIRFTVISTAWYPKNNFPNERVYGPTPDRQLRLITCGGVFDHRLRSYKDNLVVYAVAG